MTIAERRLLGVIAEGQALILSALATMHADRKLAELLHEASVLTTYEIELFELVGEPGTREPGE